MESLYAVGNVSKFIDDHPEIKELQDAHRTEILNKAHQLADPRGVLTSGAVQKILGKHSELFIEEAGNSFEHMQIGLQAFKVNDLNRSLLDEE